MNKTSNALTVTLPSDLEILMVREFDAPPTLVFEAWTNPEIVPQWWGCSESTMSVCDIDLRVGGAYRWVMSYEGQEHPFKGVYKEIDRPDRLVYTQAYDVEPYSNMEALVTMVFEDLGGRTRMTSTVLHATKEARDGHVNSGMESGAAESLDRLEAHLEKMG